MKILTILGSPKENGKTAKALKLFEENILSQGNEVESIHIKDYNINGCQGCYACMGKKNEPGCVQKDDAASLFDKMAAAKVIVLASPLYSFDLTAQLKPFVDRCFCLTNTTILNGKRMALLITCAGPVENNTDLVQEFFRRAFDGKNGGMFHTEIAGKYVVPFSDAPDFMDRAKQTADIMSAEIR
ncbi:flavodoxin family protein [Anaerocolumna sp. MB42-C2]|uniref:flavodoxin family protein n=1 Tax=Anaerocolumna sp. MB42-C2 TaxID=3070997 RepID=UPI0027E0DE0D|nr:flavodoxin family protein [Anaerocolumna sp. MB42-C2]WMJ86996.1 flavodoxin family protein [Anaerocolumna sp. MB42-C2]